MTEEERRYLMGVGLGGIGVVGDRSISDKGVHEEAKGKNPRGCSREANIQTLYKCRKDGGLQ